MSIHCIRPCTAEDYIAISIWPYLLLLSTLVIRAREEFAPMNVEWENTFSYNIVAHCTPSLPLPAGMLEGGGKAVVYYVLITGAGISNIRREVSKMYSSE